MNTVNVVLNITGLNVTQKLAFGNQIMATMTGNANFTSPFPALSALQTAIDNLQAAIVAAKPGDKAATSNLHTKEDELENVLKALAGYVEYTCAGNEDVALSSGFSLKKPKPSVNKNFTAKNTRISGVVELSTKAETNAAYVWQYTIDPVGAEEWTTAGISIQAHFTVNGLTPLKAYWFRVAIVNQNGQQNWSDALYLIVV